MGKPELRSPRPWWHSSPPTRRARLRQAWNIDSAHGSKWRWYVILGVGKRRQSHHDLIGKTTCLDVLAQRKNIGVVTGDVLVDGRPLRSDFARTTAYGVLALLQLESETDFYSAEQMDVHEGTATVREALRFSAYLRQPGSVPQEEKDQYVEELIELLELQHLTEALVFSLNMESRKRLTIGVELASKPELLLFLDEPTSGLDGQRWVGLDVLCLSY